MLNKQNLKVTNYFLKHFKGDDDENNNPPPEKP